MSRLAFGFILVMLTALVVALSTGAQIYYLLALAMGMMLAVALASVLAALFTVRPRCAAPGAAWSGGKASGGGYGAAHGLFAGAVGGAAAVPARRRGPADALELTALPCVTHTYELALTAPHRGVYSVGISGVSATDVFGLFTLSRRAARSSFTVEVLPHARRLPPMTLNAGTARRAGWPG